MPVDFHSAAAMADERLRRSPAEEALIDLCTRTMDAKARYETMADKAEPAFRPVAEHLRDLHHDHADTLVRMLAARGLQTEAEPSVMGSLNKAIVSLRALFTDIDATEFDRIRDAEAHVLEAFDTALSAGVTPQEWQRLSDMRAALATATDSGPASARA